MLNGTSAKFRRSGTGEYRSHPLEPSSAIANFTRNIVAKGNRMMKFKTTYIPKEP